MLDAAMYSQADKAICRLSWCQQPQMKAAAASSCPFHDLDMQLCRLPRPVQPAELVSTPTQPQHHSVSPFSQAQPSPSQPHEQQEDLEQRHYREADDALERWHRQAQQQRRQQQPRPQRPPAYPKPATSSQGHGDSMQTRINSVPLAAC